jgi:hypothetical protein
VATFLKMYFDQVTRQKKETVQQAAQYQKFLKEWAGVELSLDMCKMDIDLHPMYDLKKNLDSFGLSITHVVQDRVSPRPSGPPSAPAGRFQPLSQAF